MCNLCGIPDKCISRDPHNERAVTDEFTQDTDSNYVLLWSYMPIIVNVLIVGRSERMYIQVLYIQSTDKLA